MPHPTLHDDEYRRAKLLAAGLHERRGHDPKTLDGIEECQVEAEARVLSERTPPPQPPRYTLEEYRDLRSMVGKLLQAGGDKRQGSGLIVAAETLLTSGVLDIDKLKRWHEERAS